MSKSKKSAELTESDRFYIKEHAGKMGLNELAAAVQKPVPLVEDFVKTLPAPKKTKFQQRAGSVAMTEAQSTADDEARAGPNQEYHREMRSCIHVIDPSRPII